MKGIYPFFVFLLAFTMICSPLRLLNFTASTVPTVSVTGKEDGFYVACGAEATVTVIPERDYIIGVVAGEMSPDSEPEALKAQAVAAYTYAKYKQAERQQEGKTYDLTDQANGDQCYISQADQVALWGENYQKNRAMIEAAVDAVAGKILTTDGKPVLALYHSTSSGKTENAEEVWGKAYPCLVSVESASDLLSPEYLGTASFSPTEFAEHALDAGVTLVGEPSGWIGEVTRSGTGMVKTIGLGGTSVKGTAVRSAFSLASANFDLAFVDGVFTFTTRGRGHGVGMSQFGAHQMAAQGSTYEEILAWYYPGAVLTDEQNSR